MAIVTLISDWYQDDYYIASVRGRILSRCPDSVFVDVSHNVPAFNTAIAGFITKNTFHHFPPGTIHLIAVQSIPGKDGSHVALKYRDHFFIGNDNGIFGLILDEEPQEAVTLKTDVPGTFPELTVFAEAACDIIINKGRLPEGRDHGMLKKQVPMLPAIDENVINGSILYIDSYRNAITNITRDIFEQIGRGRSFEILVQSNHYRINRIRPTYDDSLSGELIALFNNSGYLEIAIQYGNAAELLNLDVSSSVRIRFK
jgi:S-adenosylmethionine hydrolase